MTDWRSYDPIADRYDEVAAARFRIVALEIWNRLRAAESARTLDVGTGTGIVLAAAIEAGIRPRVAVGCDRALGMLARAKARGSVVHLAGGDVTALPFRDETFDIVTASFVLSHVRDHHRALREAYRVLGGSGTIAVSGWAAATHPINVTWSDCLAAAITRAEAQRAAAEVLPSEPQFSRPGGLEAALVAAGFSVTASEPVDLDLAPSVDEFIADRELTAEGRLARALLGGAEWSRFKARVRPILEERFGPCLRYSRRAFIVIASKRS